MSFLRFLLGRDAANQQAVPSVSGTSSVSGDTEAVRRIVSRLETLPPDRARLLAAMAYILARAAYADMDISDEETEAIEAEMRSSGLDDSQAVLVSEMAKLQEKTMGATSDFLVTREFREVATEEQRLTVLRACYHVCAADDSISGTESAILDQIASELQIDRAQASAIRSQFADKLSARMGFTQP
jgi:uncharacterized tellurite resistance protein B-like protein